MPCTADALHSIITKVLIIQSLEDSVYFTRFTNGF